MPPWRAAAASLRLAGGAAQGPESQAPRLAPAARLATPAWMVAVGYMDPGNWATDIAAGARFGTGLLFVVALASLSAIVLQLLSARLGLATGQDLARACRDRYGPVTRCLLWGLAEIGIVACDVAEVLGSALALQLLFGLPLVAGIVVTALDTVFVLGLQERGLRRVGAVVLGLVMTITVCFGIELALVHANAAAILRGLVPSPSLLGDRQALVLAIGIVGATVMPHNLYLHSALVRRPAHAATAPEAIHGALRRSARDTVSTLALALCVNVAILSVAAGAFHDTGHREVADIDTAFRLLDPLVGSGVASLVFGIALLAAGQSSTFTGTIASQVVLEGFMRRRMPAWRCRIVTRGLALLPALGGVLVLGDTGVGPLLVASQVVLGLQLPFAVWPLIRLTADRRVMGPFATRLPTRVAAVGIFLAVCAANAVLVLQAFG